MPPPVRGYGACIGIGVEGTWGTPVARTNWLNRMRRVGIKRIPTRKPEGSLGVYGQVSSMSRFPYDESDFAGGPLEWEACYDDSTLLLLAQMLGAVATTDLGGPGPYEHDITLASPVPIGMTIEQINGTGNGSLTAMAEVFEGCKFNGGKISITNGGLMVVETEVIAQTSGGLVAPGTPTFSSGGEVIQHNHTSGITVGGTPRPMNSAVITIERGLERNHELGSLFSSEPYEAGSGPTGGLDVTLELRGKWQTAAFDTLALSGAQVDIVIPFVGTGVKSLDITLQNCQVYDAIEREVNAKGAIEQVIKFRAFGAGADQGLSLLFTNGNASATAN